MNEPVSLLARTATRVLKRWLRPLNARFTRLDQPHGTVQKYIDARATVAAARAGGQTVCEYVESLWDQRGATSHVVNEMQAAGLEPCERVLEIGPGTGRYLERVCQWLHPKQYDIYETAVDWANWLTQTYSPPVIQQPTDGRSLQSTPAGSCGLVHAHGVFVYLSLVNSFEYFLEMLRVCTPRGFLIFDFFPAETFDEATILQWLDHRQRYPVVLMQQYVRSFFQKRGCVLIREFDSKYGCSQSHYLVFQKTGPA